MKKFFAGLRSYIGHTGAYFMFITVAFGILSLVMGQAAYPFDSALLWSSLLFAALVGLADFVFYLRFLGSYTAKAVVHGIHTIAAFALAFVAASDTIERGRTALVGVLAFGVLVLLLVLFRCVFHAVSVKKSVENREYHDLYTPKNLD